MKQIAIIGGGGHASAVAETAIAAGYHIVGHISPTSGSNPVLGTWLGSEDNINVELDKNTRLAIGVGFVDTMSRTKFKATIQKFRHQANQFQQIVHPTAHVSPSAKLSKAVFIGPHAIVNTSAHVGFGATIEHDCRVGEGCHVGPNSILGIGTYVVKNIGDDVTAFGSPARDCSKL